MEFLKSIFGDKPLTYAELEEKLKDNKDIKLANLATGKYVDKDKFDKAELKANDLETQLNTANETIKGFKDLDIEGLKKGVSDWEQKYKDDTTALNQKLTDQTKASKIEIALLGAKAKNTKAVKALIDEEKISLDGDNLLGINEQLEAIKKENAFLFDDGKVQNPPATYGGGPNGRVFTKQDIEKMSTDEINANWEQIQKIL